MDKLKVELQLKNKTLTTYDNLAPKRLLVRACYTKASAVDRPWRKAADKIDVSLCEKQCPAGSPVVWAELQGCVNNHLPSKSRRCCLPAQRAHTDVMICAPPTSQPMKHLSAVLVHAAPACASHPPASCLGATLEPCQTNGYYCGHNHPLTFLPVTPLPFFSAAPHSRTRAAPLSSSPLSTTPPRPPTPLSGPSPRT